MGERMWPELMRCGHVTGIRQCGEALFLTCPTVLRRLTFRMPAPIPSVPPASGRTVGLESLPLITDNSFCERPGDYAILFFSRHWPTAVAFPRPSREQAADSNACAAYQGGRGRVEARVRGNVSPGEEERGAVVQGQSGGCSGREVACPTAVIHAAKDQFFPLEHAEALPDDVEGGDVGGCGGLWA